jgi:periplasmic protein CpxP/Spy
MTSIRKIVMTCGMMAFAGVLMAQQADQSQAAANSAPTTAQTQTARRHAPMDPAREAKHMGKKLGLTSDQVKQITPILADRQQQMQGLRADTALSQTDRHAKFQSIRHDSKNKIEALLNDQQKQQFEQMQAARRNHRQSAPQAQ